MRIERDNTPTTAGRLELLSASSEVMVAAADGDESLASLLNCEVASGWSGFPEALPLIRDSMAVDATPNTWGAKLFMLKQPRTVVGFGSFKGPPSGEGEVEIGYAIAPDFQRKGLASEAMKLLLALSFSDEEVEIVLAHTLAADTPSAGLLRKFGFSKISQFDDPNDGAVWRWELSREKVRKMGLAGAQL